MSLLSELNETNFKAEVLESPLPILVDFWAPWCGPCRKQGPVLEQLAAERAESVKIAQLNVDESPDLAAAYGIDSIPTLLLFHHGEIIARLVGLRPKSDLERTLQRHAA